MPTPRYVPQSQYVKLHESGLTIEEIALELHRTAATVKRTLERAGALETAHRRSVDEHNAKVVRAQYLRGEEGMPMVWIAEDLGVSEHWVRKNTTSNPEAVTEWKQAWSFIMRHPKVMELHQEIAPRARTA